MKYITLSDLSDTIRNNIWKIPRDIDYIIGVPRSGTLCASIIASYLNVPLIDIDSFLSGLKPSGGLRLRYYSNLHKTTNKVLVIDDTVSSGRAMKETKNKLSAFNNVQFIYMCVYLEGWGADSIDLYLEDVRKYTENFTIDVLYEWNIFHHNETLMNKCLYDIDGVLCVEPPDERNEEEYIEYIKKATPLFTPTPKLGGIITYRLIKNKDITQKWLAENSITYDKLIMFNADSWEERNKMGTPPEEFKGNFYKNNDYRLFVESSDYQAKRISEISNKPVYCVETNKIYQ